MEAPNDLNGGFKQTINKEGNNNIYNE